MCRTVVRVCCQWQQVEGLAFTAECDCDRPVALFGQGRLDTKRQVTLPALIHMHT